MHESISRSCRGTAFRPTCVTGRCSTQWLPNLPFASGCARNPRDDSRFREADSPAPRAQMTNPSQHWHSRSWADSLRTVQLTFISRVLGSAGKVRRVGPSLGTPAKRERIGRFAQNARQQSRRKTFREILAGDICAAGGLKKCFRPATPHLRLKLDHALRSIELASPVIHVAVEPKGQSPIQEKMGLALGEVGPRKSLPTFKGSQRPIRGGPPRPTIISGMGRIASRDHSSTGMIWRRVQRSRPMSEKRRWALSARPSASIRKGRRAIHSASPAVAGSLRVMPSSSWDPPRWFRLRGVLVFGNEIVGGGSVPKANILQPIDQGSQRSA